MHIYNINIYVCTIISIFKYIYIYSYILNSTDCYYDKQSFYIEQRLFNPKNTVAKCTKNPNTCTTLSYNT